MKIEDRIIDALAKRNYKLLIKLLQGIFELMLMGSGVVLWNYPLPSWQFIFFCLPLFLTGSFGLKFMYNLEWDLKWELKKDAR